MLSYFDLLCHRQTVTNKFGRKQYDYDLRIRGFEDFKAGLCSIAMGQCTPALESNVQSSGGFAKADAEQDGIAMLIIIRNLMNNHEDHRNTADTICARGEAFYALKKMKHETLQDYYERFKAEVGVMERVGYDLDHSGIVMSLAADTNKPTLAEHAMAIEQLKAVRFIRGAGPQYSQYLTELQHAKLNGRDDYPTTLDGAFNILQRRKPENHQFTVQEEGVAFVTAGTNGRTYPHITCRICHLVGHYDDRCPTAVSSDATGGAGGANSFVLSQKTRKFTIPASWLLLDNQSTVDVVKNGKLLRNIRTVNHHMCIHCNAGNVWTNQQGDLPGYGVVWYLPKAIANILSLHNVASRYRVVYDSAQGNKFIVTKEDGTKKVFNQSKHGLYYLDSASTARSESTESTGAVLVNTVDENKSRYTNAEVDRAKEARALQTKIGRPNTRDFIKIVNNNLLPRCPVTKRDIMAAEDIFGPDVGSLKGKTVRRSPQQVRTDETYSPLPPSVKERYVDVTLCADVMHVNGIPFLVTHSRKIRFGTIEALSNLKEATLLKSIKKVAAIYRIGGFRVRFALMDGAFGCLETELSAMEIRLNGVAREEHVPDIERYIRTVKERVRSTYNTLPFDRIPPRMLIELASREVYWLNAFPLTDGISDTLSPRTIVTGQTVTYDRHCKFDFGQYVQTHEQHDNTMTPRTIGALALRPTGNIQGNFYFLSLSTGRVLNRQSATPLPMPNEVIERVHLLARRQKANPGLVFLDRDQQPFADDQPDESDDDDDADDDDYVPPDFADDYNTDDDGDDDDDVDYPADDDNEDAQLDGVEEVEDAAGIVDDAVQEVDEAAGNDGEAAGNDGDEHPDELAAAGEDNVEVETVDSDDEESVGDDEEDDAAQMDAAYGERTSAHNLRPRRRRSYSHLHVTFMEENKGVENKGVENKGVNPTTTVEPEDDTPVSTPQMSMKRGLKLFGEEGYKAVSEELQQLHDRVVMTAKHATDLTPEQRQRALGYLMFLKRKANGKVKGRGCADGSKQRAWTDKEEATAPTIATEAVFLTAIIDAHENRDVAIVDIPGAFMQADMDEQVHVRFTGPMVDLLLEVDPEMYLPYVAYEGKAKVLYVELLKALYGTMRAARLFWEKLRGKLLENGFVANPYDSCVVNKMINGKQCTIGWHVDDVKISHVDSMVVDHVIDILDAEFGKEAPLTKSRGKVHEYLGMTLDFSNPGQVIVDMIEYIKTVLAGMPADMVGSAPTPAASHLFQVNDNPVPLPKAKGDVFHRIVMQLLYLCQRARPELRTAISFLCRRTNAPDEDDYKKLTRVMRYLQATRDLKLVLSADDTGRICWWVDAAYGVHFDMKGHTGGTLSLGKGSVYSYAGAQKLVARSSTEAEVIGVDDLMPQMMWTGYFLKAQGFKVVDTILYQDNKSSILLEQNGRASSGKRTRHINIRYYFVADRVAGGELRIEHCPTGDMVADYFTKPLQGAPFYKLRDLIMNIDPSSPYHSSQRSVLKHEHVALVANPTVNVSERKTYRDVLVTGQIQSNDAHATSQFRGTQVH